MEIYTLDKNQNRTGVVEGYKSLLWTDKHYTYGNFKMNFSLDRFDPSIIVQDDFLDCSWSDSTMIIESLETNHESNSVEVYGRSLESILSNRVLMSPRDTSPTKVNAYLKRILTIIYSSTEEANPMDQRTADMPIYCDLTWNPNPPSSPVIQPAQRDGELLDIFNKLAIEYGFGVKMTKVIRNYGGFSYIFEVTFPKGVDRSTKGGYASRLGIPRGEPAIFSRKLGNLTKTKHLTSSETRKDVAYVRVNETNFAVLRSPNPRNPFGLARKVLPVDAGTINLNGLSATSRRQIIDDIGRKALAERQGIDLTEGEITSNHPYAYGIDYNLGDIVTIGDPDRDVRVIEYTWSIDEKGVTSYPIFEAVK